MIGAGAVGSAVATLLADQGRDVLLAGPALATDASRVAAGMIAPLSEAALDPASRDAASVLSAGALAWPAFAERFGIPLRACGGLLLSPSPQVGAVQPGEQVSFDFAQSLAPFLQRWDGSIRWLPDELAVDAEAALRRLEAQFIRRGGGGSTPPCTRRRTGPGSMPAGGSSPVRRSSPWGRGAKRWPVLLPSLRC